MRSSWWCSWKQFRMYRAAYCFSLSANSWQLIFTFIKGHITPTESLGYFDLTAGVPALLICIEAFLISILMHFTYGWRPYVLSSRSVGHRYHSFLTAISAALNPLEIFREFAYGFGLASPPRRYNNVEIGPEVPLQPYEPLPNKPQDAYYSPQGY